MNSISDITEQEAIQVLKDAFPEDEVSVNRFRTVTQGKYKADSLSFMVKVNKRPMPCQACGIVPDREKYFHGPILRDALSKCLEHFGKTATLQPAVAT